MVENKYIVDNSFIKSFKTNFTRSSGIPMISAWSVFSIYKNEKMIADYALTPDIFKVFIDEKDNVFFEISIQKVNKKWPKGELSYLFQVLDHDLNTVFEELGTFDNDNGKNKKKKKKVARPWDFLMPNTEYATAIKAKERLDICKGCPKLKANVCQECGCFMPLKTKLKHAECPIGKW